MERNKHQLFSSVEGGERRRVVERIQHSCGLFSYCDHRWNRLFRVAKNENIFLTAAEENLTEFSCLPSPMWLVFSGRRIWDGFPPKWLQLFPQDQSDVVSVSVYFGSSFWLEPGRMTKFSVGLGTLDKHSSVSDSLTFNVLMNSALNFFWKNVKAMEGISYNLTFVFK